jgi:hypothetical protein
VRDDLLPEWGVGIILSVMYALSECDGMSRRASQRAELCWTAVRKEMFRHFRFSACFSKI